MFLTKRFQLFLVLILFCVFLMSSCGPSQEEFAATSAAETKAAATNTPSPTSTPEPTSTETSTPTITPTFTITPSPTPETIASWDPPVGSGLIHPRGTLVEIWNGIAILSNAISGGEAYGGYYFSVDKTLSEVRQYYQQELRKTGYYLSALGEDAKTIKLVFTNGEDQIVISALSVDEDYTKAVGDFDDEGEFIIEYEIPEFHGSWVLIKLLSDSETIPTVESSTSTLSTESVPSSDITAKLSSIPLFQDDFA